ncbi:MAG: hypothetical protein ACPKQO_04220 [Nitrososphaeraceae archaeon]
MVSLSKETANNRIKELKIILKYMSFLQKNGFSDCGRGQILGQISLLEEFVNENGIISNYDDYYINKLNVSKNNSQIENHENKISNTNKEIINDLNTNPITSENTFVNLPQYYDSDTTTNTTTTTTQKTDTPTSYSELFNFDQKLNQDNKKDENEYDKPLKWLETFKNETEISIKKKPFDYIEKSEIAKSWKNKIRKMTQSDII